MLVVYLLYVQQCVSVNLKLLIYLFPLLCICAHIQVYALDLALKGYRKYWAISPPSRHPYFKQPTNCDGEIECSNHHVPFGGMGQTFLSLVDFKPWK